jgi:hypothetical protein
MKERGDAVGVESVQTVKSLVFHLYLHSRKHFGSDVQQKHAIIGRNGEFIVEIWY